MWGAMIMTLEDLKKIHKPIQIRVVGDILQIKCENVLDDKLVEFLISKINEIVEADDTAIDGDE
jgi:hypothetical protein